MSKLIPIYRYNKHWPECYFKQIARIKKYFPKHLRAYFMHVGSTSIPDCYTSGNLDIALGTSSVLDLITIRDVLAVHGYKNDNENSKLHHYVVTRGINGTLTVKIHIMVVNSQIWNEMYQFKTILSNNKKWKDKYNLLRFNLSLVDNCSLEEYSYQKRIFRERLLSK